MNRINASIREVSGFLTEWFEDRTLNVTDVEQMIFYWHYCEHKDEMAKCFI